MEEDKIIFEYELVDGHQKMREQIQKCEGRHIQQVAYSTFEDSITQICFGCMKVRSTMRVRKK